MSQEESNARASSDDGVELKSGHLSWLSHKMVRRERRARVKLSWARDRWRDRLADRLAETKKRDPFLKRYGS